MTMRPIATTRSTAGMATGQLAVWWVVASEIVIFGGLLAAYIQYRMSHPDWAGYAEHTNVIAGAFNTFVLLSSSLSAVLAHQAAEAGDGRKAGKLLGLTMVGALVFLTVKGLEWTTEIQAGYTISSNGFWAFYYTAAGIHALHVVAGAIIMGFVARDALAGRQLHRVELIGIYWHFVDIVWIFLFPLLYIAK
ncbi:MAG: cytochrome oxidase subunit III [Chloroflexi bacterium]|nr:cytochrome oxidase subunit III [Chloroflexota bacterium]